MSTVFQAHILTSRPAISGRRGDGGSGERNEVHVEHHAVAHARGQQSLRFTTGATRTRGKSDAPPSENPLPAGSSVTLMA